MKIIAKTHVGTEYLYNARTAHKVSVRGANGICETLNKIRYELHEPNEIWHVYEIDEYCLAYDYARFQDFHLTARGLKEHIS